jgi:hypothetical protein
MSSWRDNASDAAQQALDELLNVALEFAQQQLASRGTFFPYAAAIDTEGHARMIAARPDPNDEHPHPADVATACFSALGEIRNQIQASAVITDVRLRNENIDAIRVDLEHAEGHALTILLPYTKKRLGRGVDYGEIRAQSGQRQVWR